MPHAESTTETTPMFTSAPTTNGDKPNSQFLSHLTSYPLVSDALNAYKSNPVGARSLSVVHSARTHLVDHLGPYAATPYAYLQPYLSAADGLGNSTLVTLDNNFPLITKDTATVRDTVADYVLVPVRLPLTFAHRGREYLAQTYGREYRSCGGEGVVSMGKAMLGTGLVVVGDAVSWAHTWIVRAEREVEGRVHGAKKGRKAN